MLFLPKKISRGGARTIVQREKRKVDKEKISLCDAYVPEELGKPHIGDSNLRLLTSHYPPEIRDKGSHYKVTHGD